MVSILLVTTLIAGVNVSGMELSPKVATRFEGVGKHYLEIRKKVILPLDFKTPIKETFCETFLQTSYFAAKLESYVEFNVRRTIKELWKYQRNILDHYYTLKAKRYRKKRRSGSFHYIYEYKYDIQSVTIGSAKVSEFMHMCLVRNEQTRVIKQYFISRPYQIGTKDGKQVNVAFLFAYNRSEQLVVDALIDDAAQDDVVPYLRKRLHLENEYLQLTSESPPDETGPNNAMCQLPEEKKLRLCALVMHMKNYGQVFKFWPGKFNVQYTCQERQLDFWEPQTKMYKEWVLGCKARYRRAGNPVTFYTSLDRRNDSAVLVYMGLQGKLVMDCVGEYVTVLMNNK